MSAKDASGGDILDKSWDDVVICYAKRTALTKAKKGGFANSNPHNMLAALLTDVKQKVLDPQHIDEVCVGNVLGPGSLNLDSRLALMLAGYPDSVTSHTVNRMCSSGLQACAHIFDAIKSGSIDVGVGAGFESMSRNDMNGLFEPSKADEPIRESQRATDCLIPMGITSDILADTYGIKREEIDQFAFASHGKAAFARKNNKSDEILPIKNDQNELIYEDDGIRDMLNTEPLTKLKTVFSKKGVTTAGNSSQISDGAAVVVLARRNKAEKLRLPIIGKFFGYAVAGVPPSIMGIGPAVAIPKLLEKLGVQQSKIDIFEINEAFATQALYCIRKLEIDQRKVNPRGGAIAIGHPLGCTGARMVATLLSELQEHGTRYGIVSMCIGTGMGMAAMISSEYKEAGFV